MNKLTRTVFGGMALAAPLLLTVTTPAVAHPLPHVDVVVIQGSGTISPGLGLLPEHQSISFTGTATGVGTDSVSDGIPFTYGCSFSGEDPAGSVAAGAGTVAGSCGPLAFELCVFGRAGGKVSVVCASTTDHKGGAEAECVFTPHGVLPTTSYDLICEAKAALV
jgi:hypothetical protein